MIPTAPPGSPALGVGVRFARPDEYERIADLTVEGFRSRNSAPWPATGRTVSVFSAGTGMR
ncbi:hypothetical protein SSOG_08528 [Streptomyces himastatinicus ATCC 53653]|uniref:Uncharacterized protein n=1 Tax=Streptomyces himastatinicus ATCC 53653 TaxID=457427 RepID=D9W7N4_9ACTN|nr:hypothetical protein [Streptomyces himastatinicus]EFL28814.1 hypothetical protein SSOG_08528 [Streptomyces himastatinicus ATCC 53653]